jgi:flagellar motor switch protein FliN
MSTDRGAHYETPDPNSRGQLSDDGEAAVQAPLDLWDWLPRLSLRQVRLEDHLSRWKRHERLSLSLSWLEARMGAAIELGAPEIIWRASGLKRSGLIAQFRRPKLNTRLAFGLEVPLAHTVVDRLLGYDRPLAESRLQLTPVEWGVWTYLVVRALEGMHDHSTEPEIRSPSYGSSPDRLDVLLDRVGPDPFDATGLGALVTIRWPVHVASTTAAARLWLPESMIWPPPESLPPEKPVERAVSSPSATDYGSLWRAEAGLVAMSQGLRRLRPGGVLPLFGSVLGGTPQSPSGPITLACDLSGTSDRYLLPAESVSDSMGRLVRLTGALRRQVKPREPLTIGINKAMNVNPSSATGHGGSPEASPELSPLDVPVTLTVELGRVNLSLGRLADLKPGDVIELGRHSREPVELTSNGRLVARGELILIDTELGVRVTHVFL